MIEMKKIYALYKGEELLADGTSREIALKLGIKESTVLFYHTPTYHKRSKSDNCRVLILIDTED